MKRISECLRSSFEKENTNDDPPSYHDIARNDNTKSEDDHKNLPSEKEQSRTATTSNQFTDDQHEVNRSASVRPTSTTSDILIIKVGTPIKREYSVSRSKIYQGSAWVRQKLRESQPNADARYVIDLEIEDQHQVFELLVYWLTERCLPEYWYEHDSTSDTRRIEDIYAIVKQLQMYHFMNYIMDVTIELFREKCWASEPNMLFSLRLIGREDTPMFRFNVDSFVCAMMIDSKTWLKTDSVHANRLEKLYSDPEMTRVVMQGILEYQTDPRDPLLPQGCLYHDHTDGCRCTQYNEIQLIRSSENKSRVCGIRKMWLNNSLLYSLRVIIIGLLCKNLSILRKVLHPHQKLIPLPNYCFQVSH